MWWLLQAPWGQLRILLLRINHTESKNNNDDNDDDDDDHLFDNNEVLLERLLMDSFKRVALEPEP